MSTTHILPLPNLSKVNFDCLEIYTDEILWNQRGIRIAFTTRHGGVSLGPYSSLNLAMGIGDEAQAVLNNRSRLFTALRTQEIPCIVPVQIHGDTVVSVTESNSDALAIVQEIAGEGADAVAVMVSDASVLLCYADCVPVIIVSPSGAFAVVHAGWRGILNGVCRSALEVLMTSSEKKCDQDYSLYNIYVGPHIHAECFEVEPWLAKRFLESFGKSCLSDEKHVDLHEALRVDLLETGIVEDRVSRVGLCTACHNDEFFSYRYDKGACGRHGAFAVRMDNCR